MESPVNRLIRHPDGYRESNESEPSVRQVNEANGQSSVTAIALEEAGAVATRLNICLLPFRRVHLNPNFERTRVFIFVYFQILDVRGSSPPAIPTFGCSRRNGKRRTKDDLFLGRLAATEKKEREAGKPK